MAFLLDSDVTIYFLDGMPEARTLVRQLFDEGVAISVITYMEVVDGLFGSVDATEAIRNFDRAIERIPLLPVTPAEARRCASLRYELRASGRPVRQRALDLLIAATALVHGLQLVTNNPDDYADISGLAFLPANIRVDQ